MNNIPYSLPHTLRSKIIQIVGKCQSCGEDEVLDLHHINEEHHDNDPYNHVVLCPNCHARVHRLKKTIQELCPSYKSWIDLIE